RSPLASFDAWSVWAFKARMFALGGPRPDYFRDHVTLHTHPDYPLNLPLAEAALFRLPASLALSRAGLLGPACLAALPLLAYAAGEILRRDTWPRARAWTTMVVILGAVALPLPWLLFTHLAHPLGRDFLPLTPTVFVAHAGRLPHIATFFVLQMLAFKNWS